MPGLWFYVGYNPETEISYAVIDVIAKFMSELAIGSKVDISLLGRMTYDFAGGISTIFTLVFAYFTGGGWGILLLFAAFIGGYTINYGVSIVGYTIQSVGIWLFIAAWLIAPFIPVNEEYAL